MPAQIPSLPFVEAETDGGKAIIRRRRTVRTTGWTLLQAWHLLSMDAPSVAVVWALLLGRVAGKALAWTDVLVLGVGTWLVYVADRLLDGRPGQGRAQLRERHQFYAARRGAMLVTGAAVTAALAILVTTRLRPELRTAYASIFACALAYFAAVHVLGPMFPRQRRWPSKEAAVGVLFASACVAPAWTVSRADHWTLVAAALLFAALCWLNCIAIEKWEGRAQIRLSPNQFRMGTCTRIRMGPCPTLTCAAAILAAAAGLTAWAPGLAGVGSATALSALLLLALDRSALSPRQLRVLADAALLTPLALLLR